MKKILLSICLLLGLCAPLLQPYGVFAATDSRGNAINDQLCKSSAAAAQSPACKKTSTNPVSEIIVKAARLLSVIAGVAAVILIIIAGIKFSTSSGDATKAASARNTIIYAVIGLVIVAIAQSIVIFITKQIK